jgi:hypothetical protein
LNISIYELQSVVGVGDGPVDPIIADTVPDSGLLMFELISMVLVVEVSRWVASAHSKKGMSVGKDEWVVKNELAKENLHQWSVVVVLGSSRGQNLAPGLTNSWIFYQALR